MYAPFISKTNHSFSPNASNRNTNFVFICTTYVLCPKQCIKKDLRQPTALITFIHRGITRAQWHSNEIGSSLKIENTSSMACQGRGFSGALTRTHTLSPDIGMIFFFLEEQNTVAMHLKSAICLSCQPAVIFINNSKNILWDSFCFQIRSCDSFGTREHWVNCNVLTCQ